MENLLRQKYKLPKSAARSIVAEAKSLLKIPQDVMFSKPMEQKCILIAEERGFLQDGKPVEKKPVRTTWIPSSTLKSDDLRNKVTEMLAHAESSLQSSNRNRRPDQRPNSRLKELNARSSKSVENGRLSNSRSQVISSKNTATERPRKSRFVPSASVSRVLDPIVEASYSTDDESVESVSEKIPRRSRRNISTTSQDTTTSASTVSASNLNVLLPMRNHIMSIVEGCEKLDVVADHAKGFRATDFDSRSFASTVSTDGESVSSSGSSLQWGLSPRRTTDSPRKSVSMGSTTVKSLAMRFESYEKSCESPSSPKPVSRYLSDDEKESDDDEDAPVPLPPIRVLGQPPVGIVTCPRF